MTRRERKVAQTCSITSGSKEKLKAGTPSTSLPKTRMRAKLAVKIKQNCSVAIGSLGNNGN